MLKAFKFRGVLFIASFILMDLGRTIPVNAPVDQRPKYLTCDSYANQAIPAPLLATPSKTAERVDRLIAKTVWPRAYVLRRISGALPNGITIPKEMQSITPFPEIWEELRFNEPVYAPGRKDNELGVASLAPSWEALMGRYSTEARYKKDFPLQKARPKQTEWIEFLENQIAQYIEGPAQITVQRIFELGGWPEWSNAYGIGFPAVEWMGFDDQFGEPSYSQNSHKEARYYTFITLEDIATYRGHLSNYLVGLKRYKHISMIRKFLESELLIGLPALERRIHLFNERIGPWYEEYSAA